MAENYQRPGFPPENKTSIFSKAFNVLLAGTLLMFVLGVGAYYFYDFYTEKQNDVEENKESKTTELTYFQLDSPIIANFSKDSDVKLIQVEITFVSDSVDILTALAKHEPLIRNNLLFLISKEDPAELKTPEGKENLQAAILQEVGTVLKSKAGVANVQDVLFTSFVMQ